MKRLRGVHAGERATILGLGPSILDLRAEDFPPGPVITINHAILRARELRLPNQLYSMQKDGCTPHGGRNGPRMIHVPIRQCICPSDRVVPPAMPEILLLSAAESSRCCRRYPLRHVFDVERDFGIVWRSMSVPVAARIARWMGCTSILMLGHDAYTRDVYDRVGSSTLGGRGYRRAAVQAKEYAESVGVEIIFR